MFLCIIKRFGYDDDSRGGWFRTLRDVDYACGDTLDEVLDRLAGCLIDEEANRTKRSPRDHTDYEFGPILAVTAVLADPDCEIGWTGPSEAPPVADPAALPTFTSAAALRRAIEDRPKMRAHREAAERARLAAEARERQAKAAADARADADRLARERAEYERLKAKFEQP